MIRKAINTLSAKLSDGLSLSNSRLETLCLVVIGMASARTVNQSIRLDQGHFSTQLRFAFTNAFAISMSLRMMATIAESISKRGAFTLRF